MKLPTLIPFETLNNAFLHSSKPLQTTGFSSKSLTSSSFNACLTASLKPPLLANTLPKYEALSSSDSSSVSISISLLSIKACNSSKVITLSTKSFTVSNSASCFLAIHGPIKTTFARLSFCLIYFAK